MTTVAYLSVAPEGRTDSGAVWLHPEVVGGLRTLTDAVHDEGALAAAQIGHAGPVANAASNGMRGLRTRPDVQPAGHATHPGVHRGRHRAHHLGVRHRRTPVRAGRLRLDRGAPGPQLPVERVPLPHVQQARRSLRRLAGEPATVRPPGHAGRPGRRGQPGGGDRQAQHGRRRARGAPHRGQPPGGPVAGGGRHGRRARADRRQLAGQPDVPVQGRDAGQGVRRDAAVVPAPRVPPGRLQVPALLPLRGGVLPGDGRAVPGLGSICRSSCWAASASWPPPRPRSTMASTSSRWAGRSCTTPTW